jgi:hypothetical protein
MYSRQAVHSTAPFHLKIMEYAHQDYRDLRWTIGAYNSQGVRSEGNMCHFSGPALSRCWCVSITGAESSCERKSIAEWRLRPVRTTVSKYAIIAALERKSWSSLGQITREMGLSEKMILGTLHKITCLLTTTHGSHMCPDDRLLQLQLFVWLRHQRDADQLFLSNILWTAVACFRVKVWCPSTAVTCGSGEVLLPYADNVANVGGTPLPLDRLTPQWYWYSVDTLLPGLFQDMRPYQWHRSWFQYNVRRHIIKRRSAVSEHDISRKADWKCRADYGHGASFRRIFRVICPWFRMHNRSSYLVVAVVVLLQCAALCLCVCLWAVTNVCHAYVRGIRKVAISDCYSAGHCLWPVEYSNCRLGASRRCSDSVMWVYAFSVLPQVQPILSHWSCTHTDIHPSPLHTPSRPIRQPCLLLHR